MARSLTDTTASTRIQTESRTWGAHLKAEKGSPAQIVFFREEATYINGTFAASVRTANMTVLFSELAGTQVTLGNATTLGWGKVAEALELFADKIELERRLAELQVSVTESVNATDTSSAV